jgi:hypothetical protein
MNPEIENLIDMALADGDVTQKERGIILRKAESLGLDKDEVELILDGKLALQRNQEIKTTKTSNNKEGELKKCPACGASAKSFQFKCEDCGHEFRNLKAINFTLEIFKKLEEIDLLEIENHIKIQRKKDVIENIPIPNSKEDLLELLSISTSKGVNVDIDNPIYGAWRSKAREAIIKLEIIFPNDKLVIDLVKKSKKQIKFAVIRNSLIWIIIVFIVILLYFFIYKKMLN